METEPRRASFVWESGGGARFRIWLFLRLALGERCYVELRHVLHDVGLKTAAWHFLRKRDHWLAELIAKVGIPQTEVVRSRYSEHTTKSQHFRGHQNCREAQISVRVWILMLVALAHVRQVPAEAKAKCRSNLDGIIGVVSRWNPVFKVPVSIEGDCTIQEVRIGDNGRVEPTHIFERFMKEELGLRSLTLIDVMQTCLESQLPVYTRTAKALALQLSVWFDMSLQRAYKQQHAGQNLLMPLLKSSGGKRRRLDPATVLKIFNDRTQNVRDVVRHDGSQD
jgi:hypothetical protein